MYKYKSINLNLVESQNSWRKTNGKANVARAVDRPTTPPFRIPWTPRVGRRREPQGCGARGRGDGPSGAQRRNYPVPEPATLDKVYLLPEKARFWDVTS